jgi:hypothetical protein
MGDDRRAKQQLSCDVVRELAKLTNRSIEEAQATYERELAALEARAKVTMYIPVLARRYARERLGRQR